MKKLLSWAWWTSKLECLSLISVFCYQLVSIRHINSVVFVHVVFSFTVEKFSLIHRSRENGNHECTHYPAWSNLKSLSLNPSSIDPHIFNKSHERKWKWSRSVVSDFATPWTVAFQVPPSMGFSRQEHWNRLPFPSPGDLPDPGIEPRSSTLQADALPSELSIFLGRVQRRAYKWQTAQN